ncbi:hypothetical protein MA16_Dca003836 [Dendrobium catenatum]|uniref:Uncharacterized protein n=1 Tax=Dendrobium catenatum TaxID=906689 RepID=A0A2I0X1N8_9ASPA|nr:hypothetical protein MA16_Dca003836 [Dendrobium catenatum]
MKGFMMNADFHDIGFMGPRFTWCNNKEGNSRIWERLDRCLANSIAIQKIPVAVTRHLMRLASDHCPIVLKMDEKVQFKSKNIRFEDTWRSYPASKSIVFHSWNKKDSGDETVILQKKLSRTLKALFFWNKNKCRDLNSLKDKLKQEILDLQNKEALGVNWSGDDLVALRSKVHELNVTLKRLSTWWNQRAKVRWHEEGDTNSNLFHCYATTKRKGNRINQIRDELNNVYDEDEQIERVFTIFFGKKWKYRDYIISDWPAVFDSQKISEDDITFLNVEFSVLELQNSVFQQGNNKSPGLDGVTYSFYKSYWSIVGETLWKAVNSFFNSYYMHKEWKKTLIVLIPKIKSPLTPSNYRPISLCQTNYKIMATMLVNRLKKIISKLILEEQVAFVHGSMSWTSLWYVLDWYGFPIAFSKLLMECVVDVSFSIIINGKNSS